MSETPDFEQIAARLIVINQGHVATIAEQLRQVWNARGAADLAAVDDVAHTNERAIALAIQSLDR